MCRLYYYIGSAEIIMTALANLPTLLSYKGCRDYYNIPTKSAEFIIGTRCGHLLSHHKLSWVKRPATTSPARESDRISTPRRKNGEQPGIADSNLVLARPG